MVELRWYVPVEGEKVLQYRQKVDTTVRAGGPGVWSTEMTDLTANMQWSPWRDVPVVAERDPSYP